MVKAYVVKGQGIGCHQEVAHAFEKAGAEAEIIHIKQLLTGEKNISDAQIINFSGGFLHGDMLGAGMCAANELEHAVLDGEKRVKDALIEFAENDGIIYGQCNGFQLLVRTGLLPGIDNDYSRQKVTLTYNKCGNYRVAPVLHYPERYHFAFQGIEKVEEGKGIYLWCRHGEGNLQFYSEYGLVSKDEGKQTREKVLRNHVLLLYIDPTLTISTEKFPFNPNGSVDGIAGLVNENGNIFGHMAHPEVSVYLSRRADYFTKKDMMRRQGVYADKRRENDKDVGLLIFKNIVDHVK